LLFIKHAVYLLISKGHLQTNIAMQAFKCNHQGFEEFFILFTQTEFFISAFTASRHVKSVFRIC